MLYIAAINTRLTKAKLKPFHHDEQLKYSRDAQVFEMMRVFCSLKKASNLGLRTYFFAEPFIKVVH